MSKVCYISDFGGLRHYYEDCSSIPNNQNKHEVCKLSAYIWGAFTVCEKCSDRQAEEKQMKEKESRRRQMQEDLDFIDSRIQELEEVREDILRGRKVDCEDYMFNYEIQDMEDEYEYEPVRLRP